jgi:signal transduction histidine kinase
VIVKKAVELHGGTISIDSKIDAGTRITVRLPLAHRAKAA